MIPQGDNYKSIFKHVKSSLLPIYIVFPFLFILSLITILHYFLLLLSFLFSGSSYIISMFLSRLPAHIIFILLFLILWPSQYAQQKLHHKWGYSFLKYLAGCTKSQTKTILLVIFIASLTIYRDHTEKQFSISRHKFNHIIIFSYLLKNIVSSYSWKISEKTQCY